MLAGDATVDGVEAGIRLDRFLVSKAEDTSRGEIQRAIRAGRVRIDDQVVRTVSRTVRTGERVRWEALTPHGLLPASLDLSILYEDEQVVVVDKPIDLIVHPGAGRRDPTLVEGLLTDRALPKTEDPLRPGIVHRLDKETSGAIVVAKTDLALASLKRQFAEREVEKLYLAVVEGSVDEDEGWIDAPVGRDPTRPRRMTVHAQGRPAQTAFRVLLRDAGRTLMVVRPHTGRTHQIRVHLRYIEHRVVGDSLYGRAERRLMLHAWRLTFAHPERGDPLSVEAPVPQGFPAYPYARIAWRGEQPSGSRRPPRT